MPYVSKEQLTAAREVDLLTYLRCFEPQELVHISRRYFISDADSPHGNQQAASRINSRIR